MHIKLIKDARFDRIDYDVWVSMQEIGDDESPYQLPESFVIASKEDKNEAIKEAKKILTSVIEQLEKL